jgi:hypothetical protein
MIPEVYWIGAIAAREEAAVRPGGARVGVLSEPTPAAAR